MEIIEIKNLKKSFDKGLIKALDGVDFSVQKSEFVSIMGPSGCGKSTLLNIIGALDESDKGSTVLVGGENLNNKQDKSNFRVKKIGFVFQFHNLIPTLNLLENIEVAMMGVMNRKKRRERAEELLKMVGLEKRMKSLPTKVSGGERQRAAIARGLANNPEILLADEPTGNVDSKNARKILDIFKEINRKGTTIVLVTHDPKVADAGHRHIHMLDGKITKRK